MNKRILINILVIVFFVTGIYVLTKPLIAELYFGYVQRFEKNYRWVQAIKECQKAISVDPSNAKYHSELGHLYFTMGRFGQKKEEWLLKAKEAYKKAIALNPSNGSYRLELGKIDFEFFSNQTALSSIEMVHYINNFKLAVELEPNNYYVNATAGFYCLLFQDRLKSQDKEFALSRLRYALELNPSYSKDVYSSIWKKFGDFALLQKIPPPNLKGHQELLAFIQDFGLWQYRKAEAELVNAYKQKEQPELFKQERLARFKEIDELKQLYDSSSSNAITEFIPREKWQGKTGENVYTNGNMYWTGTIHTLVNLTKGKTIISIQASGSPANGVYPYMIVELDGEEIGEVYVSSIEWKDYTFEIETDGGKKVLSVSFINDGGNQEKKEDRNLFVGDVKIIPQKKQENLLDNESGS